jgi:CRP-like cAMP-binding protein
VATKRRQSFNPKTFLAESGEGRTIENYRTHQVVFSQGDPADAVFYILKGQVKVAIVSRARKASTHRNSWSEQFLRPEMFSGSAKQDSDRYGVDGIGHHAT